MGHGKNKQKTQKVGLGQQPKETREQRRLRIEEEAKAREFCMKILPYVGGAVVFIILLFALYVHSLPPKFSKLDTQTQTLNVNTNNAGDRGATFEEAMQQAEMMNGGGVQVDEDVVNLDGDSL